MAKLDTKTTFAKGVTYEAFLANVKGKVTVDSLITDSKLDQDAENRRKEELNSYKKK